jgi:hypothetical protein
MKPRITRLKPGESRLPEDVRRISFGHVPKRGPRFLDGLVNMRGVGLVGEPEPAARVPSTGQRNTGGRS